MGFRERPEYQDWREAVFRLFGRRCIRCGYAGNIHAHHVMPVEDYPELAFEPTNGVPLCGNCHTEIKGNELAHADDLKRRQRAIVAGESVGVVTNEPTEAELRERAYAEPSNTEAVEKWFQAAVSSDAQTIARAVVDFYNQHHQSFAKTARLLMYLLKPLATLERWEDVIKVADAWARRSEREGTLESDIWLVGFHKSEALRKLGRITESVVFLCELVARFPDAHFCLDTGVHLNLHNLLSQRLDEFFFDWHGQTAETIRSVAPDLRSERLDEFFRSPEARGFFCELVTRFPEIAILRYALSRVYYYSSREGEDKDAIEESARHALKAVELAPDDFITLSWAGLVLSVKGDHASALRYSKHALAIAPRSDWKIIVLQRIADTYISNRLYADARAHLREAIQIDDSNVSVIESLAYCYYMENNTREAVRMARLGLMLDPNNESCQKIRVASASVQNVCGPESAAG